MTPEEPDKSAFADEPFSKGESDLNGAESLFDRMESSSIGERQESISDMVEGLLDRLGDE